MNDLKLINQDGQVLADSREVATATCKRHDHLIRDIEGYIKILSQNPDLGADDFFIESTYKSGTGKQYKMFYLTKIGCDMVANKMIGAKGVLFTAAYTKKFEEMEKQLQGPKLPGTYREALQQLLIEVEEKEKLETQNLVLTQQVQEFQPKASYYDLVLQNNSLLSVSKIAKDYGMSGISFNRKLHELGVQYKQGDIWLLYAKHQDKGYTQTSTHVIDAEKAKVSTKWTQKGRLFLYELLKQHGILPVIERENRQDEG
ncbi:phage antirepressor KilAC domain-containing protein [Terribacillus halophilus]|uniref:phage antirepressor KilAC domain-containing protein n=1 Tax=Terribacillus halophilus TaxID=361279 RepID=UPI003982C7B1